MKSKPDFHQRETLKAPQHHSTQELVYNQSPLIAVAAEPQICLREEFSNITDHSTITSTLRSALWTCFPVSVLISGGVNREPWKAVSPWDQADGAAEGGVDSQGAFSTEATTQAGPVWPRHSLNHDGIPSLKRVLFFLFLFPFSHLLCHPSFLLLLSCKASQASLTCQLKLL